MRRALKRHLLPAIEKLGFAGGRNEYQRRGEMLDLITLQYWKYGGEFILELAQRERGALNTSWGEVFPEEEITTAHIDPLKRARLVDDEDRWGDHLRGFKFEDFGDDVGRYDQLALRVVAMLPQVESWLANRAVGPNIEPFSIGNAD